MGDHRVSVKIEITGIDGREAKIDWWLNWNENMPSRLFHEVIKKAESVGLLANHFPEPDDILTEPQEK